jgi:FkbM family methyltransferase
MSAFTYHTKIYLSNLLEIGRHVAWRLSSAAPKNIKVIDNQRFKFKKFGFITEFLYAKQPFVSDKRGFEYKTLTLFSELAKPNMTVLDIGANVGLFSLLGGRLVGEKGKIYAFEPSQITFDALNENLSLNQITNVSTHRLALSDTEGVIHLGAVENDAMNFIDVKNQNQKGEVVDMITLDKFLTINKIGKVDLIKIDIEGAELLALKGAADMLRRDKPTIIMEANDKWTRRFDYSVFDLLLFLHQFGYRFEEYDETQWLAKAL